MTSGIKSGQLVRVYAYNEKTPVFIEGVVERICDGPAIGHAKVRIDRQFNRDRQLFGLVGMVLPYRMDKLHAIEETIPCPP